MEMAVRGTTSFASGSGDSGQLGRPFRRLGAATACLSLLVIALALMDAGAAHASAIYAQPPTSPVQSVRLEDCPGPDYVCSFGTIFDYFTLPKAGVLTGLTWQGAYLYPAYNVDQSTFVPAPSAVYFQLFLVPVSGYTCLDSNCAAVSVQGGAPIYLQARPPVSQVNETYVATQRGFVDPSAFINIPLALSVYNYQYQLGAPVDLPAGNYFLKIDAQTSSNIASGNPQDDILWTWAGGTGGNSLSFGFDVGPEFITNAFDGAFTLQGTSVPEPPIPLLLGTALLGLAGASRWREVKRRPWDFAPPRPGRGGPGSDG